MQPVKEILTDTSHPLWSFLRLLVLMVSLTVVLYVNASNFDATEIRTLVTMFLLAASAEGGLQLLIPKKDT